MKMTSIRIEGLYDWPTFKFLKDRNINEFNFDFRPLSFNFLPQHRFFHLLEQEYSSKHRYYLHYCHEADFVIQKMIDDLSRLDLLWEKQNNFYLEFSDSKFREFYDQFKTPYFWHYQENGTFKELLKSPYLKGVIFSSQFLDGLKKRGGLPSFVKNFFQLIHQSSHGIFLEIILHSDWELNHSELLVESFDFNYLSLPINQNVESCYRNVNLEKLHENLLFFKESMIMQKQTSI